MRIQYGGTALALHGFLARELAAGEVVFLADFVRQAAVHQCSASKPELLAPGAVFNLVSEYLFQGRGREVIAPK